VLTLNGDVFAVGRATFFDSLDIGYCGFLERIRFAVDPQTNDFYFGTA